MGNPFCIDVPSLAHISDLAFGNRCSSPFLSSLHKGLWITLFFLPKQPQLPANSARNHSDFTTINTGRLVSRELKRPEEPLFRSNREIAPAILVIRLVRRLKTKPRKRRGPGASKRGQPATPAADSRRHHPSGPGSSVLPFPVGGRSQ